MSESEDMSDEEIMDKIVQETLNHIVESAKHILNQKDARQQLLDRNYFDFALVLDNGCMMGTTSSVPKKELLPLLKKAADILENKEMDFEGSVDVRVDTSQKH